MPRIGVSITKSCPFRGATQEFSNVYYYEMVTTPSQSEADGIIDSITTLEKTFHSTGVTFVRGRLWLETGNKATSEMISQKNLSGTGARAAIAGLDPERAYLFRARAGNDSRGNPVYLRKWYHSVGQFAVGVTVGTGQTSQQSSFTNAEKDTLRNAMQGIGDAGGAAGSLKLVAKTGRQIDQGATWTPHSWFEHHQMGDMWRAA
jgi:hypothetical protein